MCIITGERCVEVHAKRQKALEGKKAGKILKE